MSNSLLKKLISGAIFNVGNVVLQVVLGLFVFKYMLSYFGDHDFGQWSVIMALLAHVTLFEFGLNSVISRQVSILNVSLDERVKILSTAFLSIATLGGIFLLLCISAGLWFYFSSASLTFDDGTPILLISALLAFNFFFIFISGGLQSYLIGQFIVNTVNTIRLIVNLARSLGIVTVLYMGLGITGVAVVFFAAALIEFLARFYYSIKSGLLNEIDIKLVDMATFNYLKSRGARLIFLRINDYIRNNSGILVCGALIGSSAIIPLRISGRLMEIYVEVLSSINYLLTPYFSKFIEDESDFNKKFVISTMVSTTVSLFIYINIVEHGEWFLGVWLGSYSPITLEALFVLALGFALANMQGPVTAMLIAKDRYKTISLLSRCEIGITIIGMYVLVTEYGVIGAAYAVTLSLILTRGILQTIIVCNLLSIPLTHYLSKILIAVVSISSCFLLIRYAAELSVQTLSTNYVATYLTLEAFTLMFVSSIIYKKVLAK
jgi:O-antigen/teichoic acid export membrane protein